MGTPRDTPDYLEPYERATRAHGPGFRATLWASKEKQIGRFEILASMAQLDGASILDAGSASGDLAAFLVERGIGFLRYTGVEGVRELADAGGARALPRSRFVHRDFVGDDRALADAAELASGVDVVVFSGSLNTLSPEAAVAVLDRAWAVAGRTLAFNFLPSRPAAGRPPLEPGDPARRHDPLTFLGWALDRSPNVRFRQDYFNGHDATITMSRPG